MGLPELFDAAIKGDLVTVKRELAADPKIKDSQDGVRLHCCSSPALLLLPAAAAAASSIDEECTLYDPHYTLEP